MSYGEPIRKSVSDSQTAPWSRPDPLPELTLMEKAEKIIHGERAQTYGDAKDSFNQIADLWTAYLSRCEANQDSTPIILTGMDVANMMILMKVSRAAGGYHEDSYVDIIGYAALTEKLR
jgi:hypothetical protein